jgi:beta-galactosidase/beta-glucuronidase
MKLKNIHIKLLLATFVVLVSFACQKTKNTSIDLSGQWSFKMDSLDKGVSEEWFYNTFSEVVTLPGSMNENGKGNIVNSKTVWTGNMWNDSLWYKDPKMAKYRQKGNVKFSFWLTPNKEYKGAAWYQKQIVVPEDWKDKTINLFLERVHWESTVWIDGVKVGMQNSLGTPHNYSLNKLLTVGEHKITLRIDNRIKDINVGKDAHSISDNTQSNWNGVIGDIKLTLAPKIRIGNVKLYPNIAENKVKAVVQIENKTVGTQIGQIIFKANIKSNSNSLNTLKKEVKITGNQEIVIEYDMGENPKLWDEFNPNIYQMQITLESQLGLDTKSIDFGMRDFKAEGTIFKINDRPVFLRGTLECAIFPLTGYPPTDVAPWKRILKIIKKHGLNHMRFHSWCPPEAAFIAADEEGVYLQVEASAWTTIGDGAPIDRWLV